MGRQEDLEDYKSIEKEIKSLELEKNNILLKINDNFLSKLNKDIPEYDFVSTCDCRMSDGHLLGMTRDIIITKFSLKSQKYNIEIDIKEIHILDYEDGIEYCSENPEYELRVEDMAICHIDYSALLENIKLFINNVKENNNGR